MWHIFEYPMIWRLSIIGSKGLSADHVIVIGFDNVNFSYISRNAFYVAMTRARYSLHIVSALKAGGSRTTHEYINLMPESNISFNKYLKSNRSITELTNRAAFITYLSTLARAGKRRY
jgi:superfamily I DNA and RNA helicase